MEAPQKSDLITQRKVRLEKIGELKKLGKIHTHLNHTNNIPMEKY
jgi:hypothetical protein